MGVTLEPHAAERRSALPFSASARDSAVSPKRTLSMDRHYAETVAKILEHQPHERFPAGRNMFGPCDNAVVEQKSAARLHLDAGRDFLKA